MIFHNPYYSKTYVLKLLAALLLTKALNQILFQIRSFFVCYCFMARSFSVLINGKRRKCIAFNLKRKSHFELNEAEICQWIRIDGNKYHLSGVLFLKAFNLSLYSRKKAVKCSSLKNIYITINRTENLKFSSRPSSTKKENKKRRTRKYVTVIPRKLEPRKLKFLRN